MTELRKLRLEKRISQSQLARDARVSIANMCRYDNGWCVPSRQTAERIAAVLGVETKALYPEDVMKNYLERV